MIPSTILQSATQEDLTFLANFNKTEQTKLLVLEAKNRDELFQTMRDYAYQIQAFSFATKLERICAHAQARFNRRYLALQIH